MQINKYKCKNILIIDIEVLISKGTSAENIYLTNYIIGERNSQSKFCFHLSTIKNYYTFVTVFYFNFNTNQNRNVLNFDFKNMY